MNGKIFMGSFSKSISSGANVVDFSNFVLNDDFDGILKKLSLNHYLTNVFTFVFGLLPIVFIFLTDILLIKIFYISLAICFINILYNSFFDQMGDILLIKNMKKDRNYLYAYVVSTEKYTGFKNESLYIKVISEINDIAKLPKIFSKVIADYIIDYSCNNKIILNSEKYVLPLLDSTEELFNYFTDKIEINRLITGVKSIDEVLFYSGEIKHLGYKKINKCLINNIKDLKKHRPVKELYFDLGLRKKVVSIFPSYKVYLNRIIDSINSSI